MKTIAKVLSVVLALVLLVCAFTLVISADDTAVGTGEVYNETADATYTGENCLENAFYHATRQASFPDTYNVHNTIKLMSDVYVSEDYIFVRGDVTLDLNGYTMKITGTPTQPVYGSTTPRGTFYCDWGNSKLVVTGEGKIITDSRMFFNESVNEANGAYDFSVIGTGKGIDIDFTATNPLSINSRFLAFNGGNITFENVDITLRGVNNNGQVFDVSGEYSPNLVMKNVNIEAMDAHQNYANDVRGNESVIFGKPLFNINDNGYLEMDGCSVRTIGGDFINLNTGTRGRDSDKVALNCNNTYVNIAYYDYSHANIFGGWSATPTATFNFDNSELYFGQRLISMSATSSAVFNFNDTKIAKVDATNYTGQGQTTFWTSFNVNLTGNSEFQVGAGHEGTLTNVTLYEGVRLLNKIGAKLAEGCSIYFDPAGNPELPYVVAKTAPTTADTATLAIASDMSRYNRTDGIDYNHRVVNVENGVATPVGSAPGDAAKADGYGEAAIKHGAVSTPTYAGNTYYQYTVLAPDNDPTATVMPNGSDMDTYIIFNGGNANPNTYKQIVLDIDIKAGESGVFPRMNFDVQVRGQDGGRAGGNDKGVPRFMSDGSFQCKAGYNTIAEKMPVLSTTEWNHITVVVDATKNEATYYVNGEFLVNRPVFGTVAHAGLLEGSQQNLYIQGIRLSTLLEEQKVGASVCVDNALMRGYANVGDTYTDIEATKYYLNIRDNRVNENIRVNGTPYQTVDAALKAAALAETNVQLYGKVGTQTVTTDGKVVLNGYDFDYTAESYPVIRATDSYTFDSTITDTLKVYLNYEYTDTKVDEVKLGHKIPAYKGQDFESPVAYAIFTGWEGPIGEYVTADMIGGEQKIYSIYESSLKTNKELGIKTNLSLYSNFVINIFVPKSLVDGGYITVDATAVGTYTISGTAYYAYSKSVNYAGVANATSFDIAIADTEAGVWDDDNTAPLTGERTVDVSVLGYAKAILANNAYASDHGLMRAMLNYVYEAAVYFGNETLQNTLSEYNRSEYTVAYNPVVSGFSSTAIKTIYLDLNAEAPAFVFEFGESYTGTVTVTYTGMNGERVITKTVKDATEVTISEIRVYDFDKTLTVTTSGYSGEGKYNLDAYAKNLSDASDTKSLTLVTALYNYIAAAQNYQNGIVTYADFGAVGDGVTDDFAAIYNAHQYANAHGLTVKATAGATYYIGESSYGKTANIMTNTDWTGASFIIDDTGITPHSGYTGNQIFNVSPEKNAVNLDSSLYKNMTLKAGQTNIGLTFDGPRMLYIANANEQIFIRYGNNTGSSAKLEMILVDAQGNVDPTTPIQYDYSGITSIKAYYIDATLITVKGGTFTTKANQLYDYTANPVDGFEAGSQYYYYSRGIAVMRPNTTVDGVSHYIEGESDAGGYPYGGFFSAYNNYNATFKNCIVSGHKAYVTDSNNTTMGTYDINIGSAINITWDNIKQSNNISDTTLWGVVCSNFGRNLTFTNCYLSRVDAHEGVYNLTVKDTTLGHSFSLIGGGTLTVDNVKKYGGDYFITLRGDYGSTWNGDIIMKNTYHQSTNSSASYIVTMVWYDSNFGYTCYMPQNITIENHTSNAKLYLSNFANVTAASFSSTTNPLQCMKTVKFVNQPSQVYFTTNTNSYMTTLKSKIAVTGGTLA